MPQRALRFFVQDSFGKHAATWKLWINKGQNKNDIYLACRSLGGVLKVSMHETGSWHLGFIKKFVESNFKKDHPKHTNPYIDRWLRPNEINKGVTLAYRIVVPTSSVTIPKNGKISESIIRIPAAPKGKAIEIGIILTDASVQVSGWPGRRAMKNGLAGKIVLDNYETVWVVYRSIDMPVIDIPKKGVATAFQAAENVGQIEGQLRGIIFGTDENGSRFTIDCAARYKA